MQRRTSRIEAAKAKENRPSGERLVNIPDGRHDKHKGLAISHYSTISGRMQAGKER